MHYFFIIENQETKRKVSGLVLPKSPEEAFKEVEDILENNEIIIEFHAVA